jgi:ribose 5-phosphate isomerase
MEKILNPLLLDAKLKSFAGVVDTGLFYGIADTVIACVGNKIKIFNKKKREQT